MQGQQSGCLCPSVARQNSELVDAVDGELTDARSGEGSDSSLQPSPCSHRRQIKITRKLLPKDVCLIQLMIISSV